MVRPLKIRAVMTHMLVHQKFNPTSRPPTVEEMEDLQQEFPKDVIVLDQYHGDIISVPPGYGHAVLNLRENVKIAIEMVLEQELPLYAISWYYLARREFRDSAPRDYVQWFAHAVDVAKEYYLRRRERRCAQLDATVSQQQHVIDEQQRRIADLQKRLEQLQEVVDSREGQ